MKHELCAAPTQCRICLCHPSAKLAWHSQACSSIAPPLRRCPTHLLPAHPLSSRIPLLLQSKIIRAILYKAAQEVLPGLVQSFQPGGSSAKNDAIIGASDHDFYLALKQQLVLQLGEKALLR